MTTQKRVRRKVKDELDAIVNFQEYVETGGIEFPDGRCLELIKDDVGSLAFLDSRSNKFHQQIDLADQKYIPPPLAPSVSEALTLPTKRIDCGSTVEMFAQTCNLFLSHGVCEDSAKISTYFAFTSWFPECLSVPRPP